MITDQREVWKSCVQQGKLQPSSAGLTAPVASGQESWCSSLKGNRASGTSTCCLLSEHFILFFHREETDKEKASLYCNAVFCVPCQKAKEAAGQQRSFKNSEKKKKKKKKSIWLAKAAEAILHFLFFLTDLSF